ncbi:MAG: hypothetical protein R2747_22770 [Pyrinomonadaceae bacterium]
MIRKLLFILICVAVGAGALACSSAEAPNANANAQANVPPEFSGNKINPSGTPTPGIPDTNTVNPNNVPKGGTPTPGIPDPANIGKPIKGTTPTPGIPPPEVLKKQANTIITDTNLVNNPKNVNRDSTVKKPEDRRRPGQTQPPANQ